MAVEERARLELYQKLEALLGGEAATTLMSYLPPTGWADVATSSDLASERELMKSELAGLESRVTAEFHRELTAATRTIIFGLLSAQIAVAGLALALARFAT